jgi:hypothetical protein
VQEWRAKQRQQRVEAEAEKPGDDDVSKETAGQKGSTARRRRGSAAASSKKSAGPSRPKSRRTAENGESDSEEDEEEPPRRAKRKRTAALRDTSGTKRADQRGARARKRQVEDVTSDSGSGSGKQAHLERLASLCLCSPGRCGDFDRLAGGEDAREERAEEGEEVMCE